MINVNGYDGKIVIGTEIKTKQFEAQIKILERKLNDVEASLKMASEDKTLFSTREIEEMEASGKIEVYTKKEQASLRKEKEKLETSLGGIKEMKKLPDAIVIIDPKEEHNAVAEAKKLGIPVFAMLDTNCDPDDADYPIASNDDANRSVRLVLTILADAIVDAKGGLLEIAYLDETEDDVTMEDVIKNVEAQIAENERRRRQRNEERRKRNFERKNNTNRRFNRAPKAEEEKPAEKVEEKAE